MKNAKQKSGTRKKCIGLNALIEDLKLSYRNSRINPKKKKPERK